VGLTVKNGPFEELVFTIHPEEKTLHLVIPNAQMARDMALEDADPSGKDTYDLMAKFYESFFGVPAPTKLGQKAWVEFRNQRIGEYSSLKCH